MDEGDYKATRFLQMLNEHRGVETARILLHASNVSEGYVALWERKRLDLTVEALILHDDWQPLFSEQEREIPVTASLNTATLLGNSRRRSADRY